MDPIGIVINPQKEGASKLCAKLKQWLHKKGKNVLAEPKVPLKKILSDSSLLICLGGDGTILHVNQRLAKPVPVLGVNLGRLGFLTIVKAKEIFEELEAVFANDFKIEERTLFRASLTRSGKTEVLQGLNDAVINREGLSSYLRVNVCAGREEVMSFSGDGVIIATATGSTAYSLSAGGPFVYPTFDSFLVTPLCAHSLLTRPIVLPTDKEIRVAIRIEKKRGHAALTVDGQVRSLVSSKDEIRITKAPFRAQLVVSSRRTYLKTLHEKFGLVSL